MIHSISPVGIFQIIRSIDRVLYTCTVHQFINILITQSDSSSFTLFIVGTMVINSIVFDISNIQIEQLLEKFVYFILGMPIRLFQIGRIHY